jgi:hypothetical protein
MLLELSSLYNNLLGHITNYKSIILKDMEFLAIVRNYISLFEILFIYNHDSTETLSMDKDFRNYTESSMSALINSLNIIGKYTSSEKDRFKSFESFYNLIKDKENLIIKSLLNNPKDFVLLLVEKYANEI